MSDFRCEKCRKAGQSLMTDIYCGHVMLCGHRNELEDLQAENQRLRDALKEVDSVLWEVHCFLGKGELNDMVLSAYNALPKEALANKPSERIEEK